MGRAKEEPRGRLGTLQDLLSGGGQGVWDLQKECLRPRPF